MALGARSADIMRLVLSRSVVLLVVGTAIGLSGAALLTRFLEALLFGVRPLDPASFIMVMCLLSAIAFSACWLPMRRAIRVDPAVALRVE